MQRQGDLVVKTDTAVGKAFKQTANGPAAEIIPQSSVRDDKRVFVSDNGVGFDMRYVNKLVKPLQ